MLQSIPQDKSMIQKFNHLLNSTNYLLKLYVTWDINLNRDYLIQAQPKPSLLDLILEKGLESIFNLVKICTKGRLY